MSPRPDLGPKQRLGYTGSRVDRAAERRGDIVALEQDGHCRFYAIGSETVVFTLAETRDFAGRRAALCDRTRRGGERCAAGARGRHRH